MPQAKPYQLDWPWSAEQVSQLDRMLELLFQADESRDPNAHAETHELGGVDEVELDESQITNLVADLAAIAAALALLTPMTRTLTAGAGLTGGGDLSANRTFDVGAGTGIQVNANDVEVKYGTIAGTACQGNDSRLSDARTPTAHATSHQHGGGDEVATSTPGANVIPKANSAGFLPAGFVHDEKTFTSTGNVDDLDVGTAPAVLVRFNNASAATLRGMIPGCVNQLVTIVSIGAGHVYLSHQDTGEGTAARRLINQVTSGVTPLAAGVGVATYRYDETTDRWRLVAHHQGAPITVTYDAANFTAFNGLGTATWTVDSGGDQVTYKYLIVDKTIIVWIALVATDVSGTPSVLLTQLPNGYTWALTFNDICRVDDAGSNSEPALFSGTAGQSTLNTTRFSVYGTTFTDTSADNTNVVGCCQVELT